MQRQFIVKMVGKVSAWSFYARGALLLKDSNETYCAV